MWPAFSYWTGGEAGGFQGRAGFEESHARFEGRGINGQRLDGNSNERSLPAHVLRRNGDYGL